MKSNFKLANSNAARATTTAIFMASVMLLPEFASAAAHPLDQAYSSVHGIFSGTGAKIVSLTSLGFALIGSVMRFNPAAILGAIGVAIASGVGPTVIEALLSK